MRFRGLGSVLVLLAVLVSDQGCESEAPPRTPAVAPDRQSVLIGIVPEQNVFKQKEKYEILCRLLEERIPWNFETRILASYSEAIREFEQQRLAGAVLGSFTAAAVLRTHPAQAVAREVQVNGKSTYRAYVITRRGSDITEDLETWRGKAIALVHPHTSAGYFFPISLLGAKQVTDYHDFFSQVSFLGSHDAVVYAVMEGRADLGALKDKIYDAVLRVRPDFGESLVVLRQSEEFPDATLILRSDLPQDMIGQVKSALLRLDQTEEGRRELESIGLRKFIPASPDDYKVVWEMMKHLRTPPPGIEEVVP